MYSWDRQTFEQELAAAKYEASAILDRLDELAEMYRSHGFHEQYHAMRFAVEILRIERDMPRRKP